MREKTQAVNNATEAHNKKLIPGTVEKLADQLADKLMEPDRYRVKPHHVGGGATPHGSARGERGGGNGKVAYGSWYVARFLCSLIFVIRIVVVARGVRLDQITHTCCRGRSAIGSDHTPVA
jgi:hypothetical protein